MLNKQFVGVSQYFYLFIINLYLLTNCVPMLYFRIFELNEKINLIDFIGKRFKISIKEYKG